MLTLEEAVKLARAYVDENGGELQPYTVLIEKSFIKTDAPGYWFANGDMVSDIDGRLTFDRYGSFIVPLNGGDIRERLFAYRFLINGEACRGFAPEDMPNVDVISWSDHSPIYGRVIKF